MMSIAKALSLAQDREYLIQIISLLKEEKDLSHSQLEKNNRNYINFSVNNKLIFYFIYLYNKLRRQLFYL